MAMIRPNFLFLFYTLFYNWGSTNYLKKKHFLTPNGHFRVFPDWQLKRSFMLSQWQDVVSVFKISVRKCFKMAKNYIWEDGQSCTYVLCAVCACRHVPYPNFFNQLLRPNLTYAEGLVKVWLHLAILWGYEKRDRQTINSGYTPEPLWFSSLLPNSALFKSSVVGLWPITVGFRPNPSCLCWLGWPSKTIRNQSWKFGVDPTSFRWSLLKIVAKNG